MASVGGHWVAEADISAAPATSPASASTVAPTAQSAPTRCAPSHEYSCAARATSPRRVSTAAQIRTASASSAPDTPGRASTGSARRMAVSPSPLRPAASAQRSAIRSGSAPVAAAAA
ncbi:hypothetical protein [Nocardia brasiliensis]|uniref:hypothetical protein n=1 Tax=Nocardia brasiliensis TaxID=37326 RepID=UPI00245894C1|nr:hypothetical protein [Nocardia brasiliensis]